MTLDDLIKLTRRHLVTLLLCTLVGLLAAFAWTATRTKVYTATSTAIVRANGGGSVGEAYSGVILAQQQAKSYVPLFTGRDVADRVIEKLNLDTTPQALSSRVRASLQPETVNITVTADGPTPQEAKDVADAVVTATAERAKEIEEGDSKGGGGGDSAGAATQIVPVTSAVLPTSPSYPQPARMLALGALGGLALGYLVALIRHRQDTRIRNTDDVSEATGGSSTLGVIPANEILGSPERAIGDAHKMDFATRESLRQLRTNLRFVNIDRSPRSIVITSARMGEGKSTMAANLANLLAEGGDHVVLIDADLRRPAVAGIFDIDSSVGLTQVLAGTASLEDAVQPTENPNLTVLTAGTIPPNPSELLGSHRMKELLQHLTKTHRVILDAPPLLPVTDAALLTVNADGAVIVISAGDTRKEQVARAVDNLSSVGAPLLGAVLNRVSTKRLNRLVYGSGYGYGSSYGYGYGDGDNYENSRRANKARSKKRLGR